MRSRLRLKLVSELLDLPLLDSEGKYCGIVDDLEFRGTSGKPLQLDAMLVGPGAYAGRMPSWAMWLVRKLAGDRVTKVPVSRIRTVASMVHLDCPASELGLDRCERVAAEWMPHRGAL